MKTNTIFIIIVVGFMLVNGCVSSDAPIQETMPPVQSSPVAEEENEVLVRQYLETGQAYERQGRLNSALEQYALALTVLPDHAQASTAKQEVTSKLKDKAQLHYQQGVAYDKKGQYEAARKEYLSALQNWPDHNEAKERLTPGGVTDGNRDYIIHTLKSGESVSKISLIYYGNLKKHDIIGKFNLLKDAQKVRAGQKLKVPVIESIGLTELKEKQTAYLEGLHPTDDEGLVLTEETVEEETVEEETVTRMDSFTESKPEQDTNIDDYDSIGSVPIKKEDPEKTEIIEQDPVDFYQLGIEQFKKKKYKMAIPNFTKAFKKEPDNEILRDYLFQSHFQNGLYLYSKSKYLMAKDNFSQALAYNRACEKCQDNIQKSDNSYKEKHYNLGIHYFGKENLKKAISEWKKVQEIDPAYKEIAPNLKKAELLFNRLEAIKESSSN